jgi:hypothetical protein
VTPALAKALLADLEGNYLEVTKAPGREGGYIRVPVSVNAEWYRQFCKRYLTTRRRYPKPRTLIRRCHTVAALRRIIGGRTDDTEYTRRLFEFVKQEACWQQHASRNRHRRRRDNYVAMTAF